MVCELCPSIVCFSAGQAKKHSALFTVAGGLFLVAILTVVLLGARYLLQQSMELQKAVDEERGLEARYSFVG